MLPARRGHWLPEIFNDFFDNAWMIKANSTAPAINIAETDKEFRIEVAAPGMTREDFNIRINDDNQLVVSMEKKEEKEDKGDKKDEKYLRREFSYSRFQQAMILPDNIEKDKIAARMEHGVLNISMPKNDSLPEKSKERLIEIG